MIEVQEPNMNQDIIETERTIKQTIKKMKYKIIGKKMKAIVQEIEEKVAEKEMTEGVEDMTMSIGGGEDTHQKKREKEDIDLGQRIEKIIDSILFTIF